MMSSVADPENSKFQRNWRTVDDMRLAARLPGGHALCVIHQVLHLDNLFNYCKHAHYDSLSLVQRFVKKYTKFYLVVTRCFW